MWTCEYNRVHSFGHTKTCVDICLDSRMTDMDIWLDTQDICVDTWMDKKLCPMDIWRLSAGHTQHVQRTILIDDADNSLDIRDCPTDIEWKYEVGTNLKVTISPYAQRGNVNCSYNLKMCIGTTLYDMCPTFPRCAYREQPAWHTSRKHFLRMSVDIQPMSSGQWIMSGDISVCPGDIKHMSPGHFSGHRHVQR